jgi:7-cyano-7-deazaguanine tRNA-ribosyltransferase
MRRYKNQFKNIIIFPESKKPYSKHYSKELKQIFKKNKKINVMVDSSLGPVPIELDEMYPFAQSIFPDVLDKQTEEEIARIFNFFTKNKNLICWKGRDTLKEIESQNNNEFDFDIKRVSAVSDIQFGKNASNAFIKGEIKIVKSKKTGKIRNIYSDNKHILSMRAEDGLFTLKIEGGKLLHKKFKFPQLRVVIKNEVVSFIKEGKSVFAKFVVECDPDIHPADECLIVNERDNLIAVGRSLLNSDEMLLFKQGVAVKTREYI